MSEVDIHLMEGVYYNLCIPKNARLIADVQQEKIKTLEAENQNLRTEGRFNYDQNKRLLKLVQDMEQKIETLEDENERLTDLIINRKELKDD